MWHLAFAGALPPKLARDVAQPEVFFRRLGFTSWSCDDDEGEWCVSLALPVWSWLDGPAKARLAEAYREHGRLMLDGVAGDLACRAVVERCLVEELRRS